MMNPEDLASVKAAAAEIRADRRRIRLGMALGALVGAVVTVASYYIFNALGAFDMDGVRFRTFGYPAAPGMLAGGAVYALVSGRGNPFGR